MRIELDVRDLDCNIIDLPGDILRMNLRTWGEQGRKEYQIEIPIEILLGSRTIENYCNQKISEVGKKIGALIYTTTNGQEKKISQYTHRQKR